MIEIKKLSKRFDFDPTGQIKKFFDFYSAFNYTIPKKEIRSRGFECRYIPKPGLGNEDKEYSQGET